MIVIGAFHVQFDVVSDFVQEIDPTVDVSDDVNPLTGRYGRWAKKATGMISATRHAF